MINIQKINTETIHDLRVRGLIPEQYRYLTDEEIIPILTKHVNQFNSMVNEVKQMINAHNN